MAPTSQEQDRKDHTPNSDLSKLSLSSQAVHADDFLNNGQDIAPALHVSTTFRYNKDPDKLHGLAKALEANVSAHRHHVEYAESRQLISSVAKRHFQGAC